MSYELSSEQVLRRLVNRGALSEHQVQTAAVDVLDFVLNAIDGGGKLVIMYPDGSLQPYTLVIPGLTLEN